MGEGAINRGSDEGENLCSSENGWSRIGNDRFLRGVTSTLAPNLQSRGPNTLCGSPAG